MIQSICAYSGLLNFISSFSAAVFILKQRPVRKVYQAYFFFSFFISLWSLAYCIWLFSKDVESALFWVRVLTVPSVLIPPVFLRFVITYLRLGEKPGPKKVLRTLTLLFSIHCVLSFTPLMVKSVEPRYWFQWWPVPGWFYHSFVVLFLFTILYAHGLICQAVKSAEGSHKKQLGLMGAGTFLAFVGGMSNFFLWYNIPIPPLLNILVTFQMGLMFYAVLNYKLWDIQFVIRRTVIFSGLFFALMSIVGVITAIIQHFIVLYTPFPSTLATLISFAVGILAYGSTKRFLEHLTDRFLFQNRRDIQNALKQITRGLGTVLTVLEVTQKTIQPFKEILPLESATLLILDTKEHYYEIAGSFGIQNPDMIFYSESTLIDLLKKNPEVINLQDPFQRESLPKQVRDDLKVISGNLAIALMAHGQLIGVLVLGARKSGHDYEAFEITMLLSLAGEVAVAIKNAWLLEEMMKEREQKLKAQSQAELVNYAKTIAHEIKNSLVGMRELASSICEFKLGKIKQAFEQSLAGNGSDEIRTSFQDAVGSIETYAQTIMDRAERIRVIAKTAEGTLNSNETTREEIYFKIMWDEAIRASGVKGCEFRLDIPENFIIYGNVVLLERVFINLMTNARDAMETTERKIITLHARHQEVEGKTVAWFEFGDSGPGIQSNLVEMIFKQGFTTKRKSSQGSAFASGSGYGLYVCRRTIEEVHGGKIRVQAELGKGTVFSFWLPSLEV